MNNKSFQNGLQQMQHDWKQIKARAKVDPLFRKLLYLSIGLLGLLMLCTPVGFLLLIPTGIYLFRETHPSN